MTQDRSNRFSQGVAYYPDYLSDLYPHPSNARKVGEVSSIAEKISYDFERMKASFISEVRVGEFAWFNIQPQQDKFEFKTFDLFLDLAEQHQMKVIFCTPTACPPKWLVDLDPQMLPMDENSVQMSFGSRRHGDPCNQTYRQASLVIVEKLLERYGHHPAIIGWQVDNEWGHHGSHKLLTEASQNEFQNYLKSTYECIDKLNESWFNCFWSQGYQNFEQIELPRKTYADHNPHMLLDFKRFCTKVYVEFQKEQVKIVRKYAKDRFVTTNYISDFYDLCPFELAKDIDLVGFDHYQHDDEPNPTRSMSNFTLMRSSKGGKKFKVLEQQPVQVNWQEVNPRISHDWLFLWTAQAIAQGADSMHYFCWQRFYGSPEQYHDAILPHDVRIKESWQEQVLKANWQYVEEALSFGCLQDQNDLDVAIVHCTESHWTHEICSQSTDFDTREVVDELGNVLSSTGKSFQYFNDIESAIDQQPKVVLFASYAFEVLEAELKLMTDYLNQGGKIMSFARSFMKTRLNQMSGHPFKLWDDGMLLAEFGALRKSELELIWTSDEKGAVPIGGTLWAEKWLIDSSDWKPLATFADGIYKDSPAVIKRNFEKNGCFIHLATIPKTTESWKDYFFKLLGIEAEVWVDTDLPVQIVPVRSECESSRYVIHNMGSASCKLHILGIDSAQGEYFYLEKNEVGKEVLARKTFGVDHTLPAKSVLHLKIEGS